MNNQYITYVIGFTCGALVMAVSFAMQPKTVNHNITLTTPEPIHAQLDLGEWPTLLED